MSLHKEIRDAYDQVHAPDAVVERMKQELYQKGFHEDAEEVTWQVSEAPRLHIGRYAAYVAAVLTLTVGCGMAVWGLNKAELKPGKNVNSSYIVTDTTEAATEEYAENLS